MSDQTGNDAEIERLHLALLAVEQRQLAYERAMNQRLKQGLFEGDIAHGARVEQENARLEAFTAAMVLEKAPLEEQLASLKARRPAC